MASSTATAFVLGLATEMRPKEEIGWMPVIGEGDVFPAVAVPPVSEPDSFYGCAVARETTPVVTIRELG